MTKEERFKMDMIDEFKQMCEIVEKSGRIIENKWRILKVLEQEPCEDAVSRQVALDLCERFDGGVPYSVLSNHDMLPSVTPR